MAWKEDEKKREVDKAKDSYQRAVHLHGHAQQPYVKQQNNFVKQFQQEDQKSRDDRPGDVSTEEDLPSDWRIALKSVGIKEFNTDIALDGMFIDSEKNVEQVNVGRTHVKPVVRDAQTEDQPESAWTQSDTSLAGDMTLVSMAAHVKVFSLSYTCLRPGHLSFHTGKKIKQKKVAIEEDGLAYGYIIKNNYTRQRTYGLSI